MTKVKFRWFDITDFEKEAAFLRRMHQNGLKFRENRYGIFFLFDECEPEDVIYQLDYNREGNANKAEYLQMFADCGWEYCGDCVGYSYFRKPAKDAEDESIFCDDESRLEMMERIYRGRITPLIVIFLCIVLPNLLGLFTKNTTVRFLYVILFAAYMGIFLKFTICYRRFRDRVKR